MLMLSAVSACGSAGDQDPIVVSVASSQTDVFETITPMVEATAGGRPIDLNFGGSTTLINQVNTGAPVDIIIVADQIAADAIDSTVNDQVVVADNHLVAIASPDVSVDELADLDDELIVIACDPSVPCGRLTEAWFDEAQTTVEIDSLEQNVRQVRARVESGEADVGFVYEADAQDLDRAVVALTAPPEVMSQSIAVRLTDDDAVAEAFTQLVAAARSANGLHP